MIEEKAECRGCEMELIGKPYYLGGQARHPKTNKLCEVSFYGGFVCSVDCEREAVRTMNRSIDDHMAGGRA